MNKKLAAMSIGILTTALAVGSCSGTSETADDSSELTFYIVRHGRTMLNTTDRVQGWADSPLTPAGEDVVRAAGRGMADITFQGAYSSDSGRAYQTAELLLGENTASGSLAITRDSRLRELNFGSYEGDHNDTMWTDVAHDRGMELSDFFDTIDLEDFANRLAAIDKTRPDSAGNWPAEDYDTLVTRLNASMKDIVATETAKGDGNVLIVSHGLTIAVLVTLLDPNFTLDNPDIANAAVAVVHYKDGQFTLETFNDTSFIEAGTEG